MGTEVINKLDLEKRRRIMQRSIALGHCICNPKQGFPCDTFVTGFGLVGHLGEMARQSGVAAEVWADLCWRC